MMHYRFLFTNWFNRNLKKLSRHNPHLRIDFEAFLSTLDAEFHPIIPQTGGAHKARMKITGGGKRGGYRVIYYFVDEDTVWLITIYDKVKKEKLSSSEQLRMRRLVQEIQENK